MKNGVFYGPPSGENVRFPSGPPKGRSWFNVTAEVSKWSAFVKLNGKVVHTESPRFSLVARAGVIVPNGYSNVVTSYKKCMISF